MMSSAQSGARRKPPAQRRAEITGAAAEIALAEGLERITLRLVASRLDVRPGLISHYFPAVDDLIAAAFAEAVAGERARLLGSTGSPLGRLAHFTATVQDADARDLSRLWLNARHLSRFNDALAASLETQEAIDRDELTALIAAGIATGDFAAKDPAAAAVRILIAVDGFGAYANDREVFEEPAYTSFVADVAEWALGLESGALAEASAATGSDGSTATGPGRSRLTAPDHGDFDAGTAQTASARS
ncbi:TetR family transcriptional regulator [Brevibacterium casei]